MNRRFFTLLLIILSFSQMIGAPIEVGTARKVAQDFAQTAFAESSRSNSLDLVMTSDAYFVFNVGQTGFVIVSSDDRFRPIVG